MRAIDDTQARRSVQGARPAHVCARQLTMMSAMKKNAWVRCFTVMLAGALTAACAPFGTGKSDDPVLQRDEQRVSIQFKDPQNYVDFGDNHLSGEPFDNRTLAMLRDDLVQRIAHKLPAGARMSVTFTNINMVGPVEGWNFMGSDARIVASPEPPRIDLNFVMTDASGKVLKEGPRILRDPVRTEGAQRFRQDPLRFERFLIDDWLDRELGTKN